MKARVKWIENMAYLAESGSGHALVVDGPPDLGGRNLGPRPMELLLMGLGTCSAVDVVHILRKARQPVVDCIVEIDADRAETEPKVFTTIRMHYIVSGRGLNEHHVRRAVQLSADKYCSASIMLGKSARIEHGFEIREADGPADQIQ